MKNVAQKVNKTSSHLDTERIEKLRKIFPDIFSENKIDWNRLQAVLGESVDFGREKFGFTWKGKGTAIKNVLIPSKATLVPVEKESIDFDTTENVFIEGDNLEVLKLLQKTYFEKVKMIYIDPPYNTGGDFVYKDNFAAPLQNYLEQTGQKDSEGNALQTNRESSGRYHSDWLSMMYPRLKLAWNLLKDDGLIFVSIDDNEMAHLKIVLDEIFGEENFLGCAARVAKKSNNKGDFWAPNFDYVLTYAKDVILTTPFFGGVNYEAYDQIETDGPRKGEKYQLVRLYMSTIENRNPEQRFYIDCPDGTKVIPPGSTFPPERPILGDGIWRWTRNKFNEERERIVIKKVKSSNLIDENGNPAKWNVFTKTYLNDVIRDASAKPNSLIEEHINQIGSHELGELNIPFDYPKPSTLIRHLIEIARVGSDAIILDFFAGSGSTAQAVMSLNATDKGNRKFVLVQLPETTDEKSQAFQEGFKNIADISKERIRRVSAKIKADVDNGFKVFKLAASNYFDNNFDFDPTKSEEENTKAFEMYLSKAKQKSLFPKAASENVVYENIIKEGFSLNSKVEKVKIGQNSFHQVVDGEKQMLVCLDIKVESETVKRLSAGEFKGKTIIALDDALSDTDKANLALNVELKTI